MKTFHRLGFLGLSALLGALFLVAGCTNVATSGPAFLVIHTNGLAARSLGPNFTADHYVLTQTLATGSPKVTDPVDASTPVSVLTGLCDLTLAAVDADGNTFGEGTLSNVTIADGENTLTFNLSLTVGQTGSGILNIDFSWLRLADSVDVLLAPFDSLDPSGNKGQEVYTINTASGSWPVGVLITAGNFTSDLANNLASFRLTVKSGQYLVTLIPKNGPAALDTRCEIVNIYDNQTTTKALMDQGLEWGMKNATDVTAGSGGSAIKVTGQQIPLYGAVAYYHTVVDETGMLRFQSSNISAPVATWLVSSMALDGTIFDSQGHVLATDLHSVSGANFSVQVPVYDTGDYYLRLTNSYYYVGNQILNFDLDVTQGGGI